ncbi:hypothetical protein [Leptospira koniambonensis]|uniref:hypothetical protein n=1 Tax=Leptospira koniambonensis TaxID=2484950 RepID=UPI003EB7C7EB
MSDYDLLINVNESVFNQALSSLYGKENLRNKLFKGTKSETYLNTPVNVSWDVLTAPILSLNPPTDADWKSSYKQDGKTPSPVQNAFLIKFPKLKVSKDQNGSVLDTTLSVQGICSIKLDISSNRISIDSYALIVDISNASPLDQFIYKSIIIPQILKTADSALEGGQIPALDFHGAKFGEINIFVGQGRFLASANLESKAKAAIPNLNSIPNQPFFILISKEASQSIVNQETASLIGKKQSTSGSKSFGIGTANYDAAVRINRLGVQLLDDPTQVSSTADLSITAGAGVDLLGPVVGAIVDAAKYVGSGAAYVGTTVANGVVDVSKTVAGGTVDAANTVADGATTAANAVADGATTAANAVADGAKTVWKAISSY